MTTQDPVRKNLEALVALFESGKAPEALAIATLPAQNLPCSSWSLGNRLLLWINGTTDARGYRQWQKVGRYVKSGAKAIHILGPCLRVVAPKVNKEGKDEEKQSRQVLVGFKGIPVFRVEDTDGKPLDTDLRPAEPPPLADVAAAWGVKIEYAGFAGQVFGFYAPGRDKIVLATHEEQVFYHELAHAAQHRLWPGAKDASRERREISAELASCVLARLYGRKVVNEGDSYAYVAAYAKARGKKLGLQLWGVVSDVEKMVKAIIEAHGGLEGRDVLGLAS